MKRCARYTRNDIMYLSQSLNKMIGPLDHPLLSFQPKWLYPHVNLPYQRRTGSARHMWHGVGHLGDAEA